MEKWLDCHTHVLYGGVEDVKELHRQTREVYGYCTANFLSVEGMDDAAQNALAIAFKLLDRDNYAFGGLHYRCDYDFAEELRQLWEIGLDGMKMIENKPSERRRLGYAQDDARYDGFFRTAEALDIPFLIHVNDPVENWDENACSDWAKACGYFYGDGSYVNYEQVLSESLSMLEKYPKLRICMAHLFFLSQDASRLRRILEDHPNLSIDITAGTEMYYAFDEAPEVWRQFFLDFQDRIFFGTDNCFPASVDDQRIAREINDLERDFLTRADRFPLWNRHIQGAHLPGEAVAAITGGNFRRFAGATPRPLDRAAAAAYLRHRLDEPGFQLTDREQAIVRQVLAMVEGK